MQRQCGEWKITIHLFKPIFHLATLFARRKAKTRIRQRDWLTMVGKKICCEQVEIVPTFFSVRANNFAKWTTGFRALKGASRTA